MQSSRLSLLLLALAASACREGASPAPPARTNPIGSARWPASRSLREISASASGATTATMPMPRVG